MSSSEQIETIQDELRELGRPLQHLRESLANLRLENGDLYPGHSTFMWFRIQEKMIEVEIKVLQWFHHIPVDYIIKNLTTFLATREHPAREVWVLSRTQSPQDSWILRGCYRIDPDAAVSARKKHPSTDSDTGESISPEASSGLSLRNVGRCSDSHRGSQGLELSAWWSSGGRRWLRRTCLHGKYAFSFSAFFRSFSRANSFFQKTLFF